MFMNLNLVRISLIAGCLSSLVQGQCLTSPRCVGFTYPNDGSEPGFENVDTECGQFCDNDFQCDDIDECIANQDFASCASCIEELIQYANNTSSGDECPSPSITLQETTASLCVGPLLATALMRAETCCDVGCFSAMATAHVEHKGKTLVKDLKVGDKVLTGANDYNLVYTVDHRNPNKRANFLQIYSTLNEESPLEVTEDHMVFVNGKESPIPAKAIKVGDALQTVDTYSPSIVTKISSIERKGIWNPITTDGTIAVDGIVASTYNVPFRSNDEAEVEMAGAKVMSHHDFLHLLMTPYRTMCLGLSLSLCETEEEYNGYSQLGNYILKTYEKQGEIVQDFMVFVALQIAFVFRLLSFAMNPAVVTGLVLGTGAYYFCAKKN